jgi:hypothetical protein
MKGKNYDYLENSINRLRRCYFHRGNSNEENEIVKPAKHFQ